MSLRLSFHLAQNAATLACNQAHNYFLGNVFSSIPEEFLKLYSAEFFSDLCLGFNYQRVLLFELLEIVLFFEHVLNETTSTINHLVKAIYEALSKRLLHARLRVDLIRLVPYVVSYEFF